MKSNILLVDVNILGRGGDGVPNANKYSSQVIWNYDLFRTLNVLFPCCRKRFADVHVFPG